METLILSKTRFNNLFCIGGLVLNNNQFIRLLNANGGYQPANTPLQIGQIVDLNFQLVNNITLPHNEDVILLNSRFLRNQNNLSDFIQNRNLLIWQGSILNLYNRLLQWTNSGSGYFNDQNNYPPNSVGFWLSDYDLNFDNGYYYYQALQKKIKYVGIDEPLDVIPAGTLIRVSLAKWWPDPNDLDLQHIPRGCYLQLSGWYL